MPDRIGNDSRQIELNGGRLSRFHGEFTFRFNRIFGRPELKQQVTRNSSSFQLKFNEYRTYSRGTILYEFYPRKEIFRRLPVPVNCSPGLDKAPQEVQAHKFRLNGIRPGTIFSIIRASERIIRICAIGPQLQRFGNRICKPARIITSCLSDV